MGLRKSFARVAKKAATGLCVLSLCFLAACGYPSHQMGAEVGLEGNVKVEQMFEGAKAQNHLTIDGTALQSENHYLYTGSVTINGDIPAHTEVTIRDGRLHVTGNVGDDSEIDVKLPEQTHQETYRYSTIIMVGKVPVTQWHTGHRTVVDGLAYPGDTSPAVQVDGAIGNGVTVTTNGGIEAGSWGTDFKAKTDNGRELVQTQRAAPSAALRVVIPGT